MSKIKDPDLLNTDEEIQPDFNCSNCNDSGCDRCCHEDYEEAKIGESKSKYKHDETKSALSGLELMKISFKPMEIINKDYLPLARGVLTLLSGMGGIGKSFIAIQSVARLLKSDKEATALLWMTEDPLRILQTRLKMFSLSDNELKRLVVVTTPPEELDKKLSKFSEYTLIVIDPLIYFFDGDDENNNNQAGQFMYKLNEKCKEDDNIILMLHHHSKSGTTRGASAFSDNSRLVYSLDRNEDGSIGVDVKKDNFNVCEQAISSINPHKLKDTEYFMNRGINAL